jgi:hypothetical protein
MGINTCEKENTMQMHAHSHTQTSLKRKNFPFAKWIETPLQYMLK